MDVVPRYPLKEGERDRVRGVRWRPHKRVIRSGRCPRHCPVTVARTRLPLVMGSNQFELEGVSESDARLLVYLSKSASPI